MGRKKKNPKGKSEKTGKARRIMESMPLRDLLWGKEKKRKTKKKEK